MHATRVRPVSSAIALIAAILFGPAVAQGQCADSTQVVPPPTDTIPFTRLSVLDRLGCLGGDNDRGRLAVEVRKALALQPNAATFFKPAAESALVLIDIYLGSPINSTSADLLREVQRLVGQTRRLLGTGVSLALPNYWVLDGGTGKVSAVPLELRSHVNVACASRGVACTTAFETVKEILRAAALTRSALDKVERPGLDSLLAANVRRQKSWDEYFERARSQYIWELGLNSKFTPDERQTVDGVKVGFRAVPTSQILFLHPYVAMEYASDEAKGNKFNPTVITDIIGYNWWSWNDDGSMGRAFGASFIFAAADHATTDNVALGFMAHVNHTFSVGAVFGGDKPTFVMSGDAAKLWTKVSDAKKTAIASRK